MKGRLSRSVCGFSLLAVLVFLGSSAYFSVEAQTSSPHPAEYEVISVKPNRSSALESSVRPTVKGTLFATNVTLMTLITYAYMVDTTRISGGPRWMNVERYDIEAKGPVIEGTVSQINETTRQMMQAMLRDRFHLATDWKIKPLPGFALVVAKSGLHAAESKENTCFTVTMTTKPDDVGKQPICGAVSIGRDLIEGRKLDMGVLARVLETRVVRSLVSDQTGLDGHYYDMTLRWMPDEASGGGTSPASAADNIQGEFPSLFTALQEQLGLRLEKRQLPTKVLVINGAEHPEPN